jgi:hypothetical protein
VLSQNVAFTGPAPAHPDDGWAPGHALVLSLRERLLGDGWAVTEPDAWRGSGWCLACRRNEQELQVVLASALGLEWMIQIVPTYVPGWLGRLRGKTSSASPASCYALARAVHSALASAGWYSSFRWCWDENPCSADTTKEPSPPASGAG